MFKLIELIEAEVNSITIRTITIVTVCLSAPDINHQAQFKYNQVHDINMSSVMTRHQINKRRLQG